MRYVKIKAKNYNEAIMKLKMEHGDDAIPISHKYVREGGLFNSKILAKELVELTAAIPERKTAMKKKPEAASTIDFTIRDNEVVKTAAPVQQRVFPERQDVEKRIRPAQQPVPGPYTPAGREEAVPPSPPKTEHAPEARMSHEGELAFRKLEREFRELKDMMSRALEAHGRDQERTGRERAQDEGAMGPFMEILVNNEFGREECTLLMEEVKNSMSNEDLKDKYKIEKTLKDLLKSRIVTAGPIQKGARKKVVMFIGPTGVGKTTTMAKLGALFSLRENYRVAFITIDNYRIAATEQLKKYAEIMKIPVHAVSDPKSFKEAVDQEKADIIMVDTSGRSHRNEMKISEMKNYADMVEHDFEKILCVSANTKKGDLNSVFKSFDRVNFNSVIVTKVDETSFIGNVVEIADKYKKPISYYTNGQEVPNDIDVADPEKIVNMIMSTGQ